VGSQADAIVCVSVLESVRRLKAEAGRRCSSIRSSSSCVHQGCCCSLDGYSVRKGILVFSVAAVQATRRYSRAAAARSGCRFLVLRNCAFRPPLRHSSSSRMRRLPSRWRSLRRRLTSRCCWQLGATWVPRTALSRCADVCVFVGSRLGGQWWWGCVQQL